MAQKTSMRPSKSLGELVSDALRRPVSATGGSITVGAGAGAEPYPARASDYDMLQECGRGVSASVYMAVCKPLHEVVAIKTLNLEALNLPFEELVNETALMKRYSHPNLLQLHCAFVHGEELWMVMPYCAGGSVAHILRYKEQQGLPEPLIAAIAKQALCGLDYVHRHSGIHRDVKAGNLLLCGDGTVRLADFGVSATLERGGEWGETALARRTFVGTPCWMAPEVLEQTSGYSTAADLWSFGITLLEMAHGHAPFAKYPPLKVLLMTLQGPPPQLEERCGSHRFSRAMREVVAHCLQKDPAMRPTASQLLEHRFFRHAKDAAYVKRHLLEGLPPLPERVVQVLERMRTQGAEQHQLQLVKSMVRYASDVAQWDFTCVAPPAPDGSDGGSGGAVAAAPGSAADGRGGGAVAGGEGAEEGGARALVPPAVADDVVAAVASDAERAGVACYFGGQRLQLGGPPSLPPSQQQSPAVSAPPSRPTSPPVGPSGASDAAAFAAAAAAPGKRHGRFVIHEGPAPYQGPDEADTGWRSPKPDQSSPRAGLARQRSLSSPLLTSQPPPPAPLPESPLSLGAASDAPHGPPPLGGGARRRLDGGPPGGGGSSSSPSAFSPAAGSPRRSAFKAPPPSHIRHVSFSDQGAAAVATNGAVPAAAAAAAAPAAAAASPAAVATAGGGAGAAGGDASRSGDAFARLETLASLPVGDDTGDGDPLAAALAAMVTSGRLEGRPAVAAVPPDATAASAGGEQSLSKPHEVRPLASSRGRFRVVQT